MNRQEKNQILYSQTDGNTRLSIRFCLSPDLDCPEREEEMREASDNFKEEKLRFEILSEEDIPGEDIERSFFSGASGSFTAERKKNEDNPPGILYVTDSDRIFHNLIRKGLPTVGYRHACNHMESFAEAAWILEEPQNIDKDSYWKIWQRLTRQPWTIAVTRRLLIREMTVQDLDAIYSLYEDPDAERFLPPLSESRSEEQDILEAYIKKVYGLYGYGMWAVCDRRTGELIGRAGFEPYPGKGRPVEMGYLIRRDLRHRGFATEAVQALLKFADENLEFPVIAIRTDAVNHASIRLALSVGFQEVSDPEREKKTAVDVDVGAGIRYFIREKVRDKEK